MARIYSASKALKADREQLFECDWNFTFSAAGGREEMSADIVRNLMQSAAAGVPRVPCNL